MSAWAGLGIGFVAGLVVAFGLILWWVATAARLPDSTDLDEKS